MKTIRTIIATLSGVLLIFALVAWISVRRNAAFIQRTIYQGFDQTFVVALVMGCAFLLIAVILTVAIVSTDDDQEEDEAAPVRPKPRPQALPTGEKRPAAQKRSAVPVVEQPYRRVTRARTMDQDRAAKGAEEGAFARPKAQGTAEKPPARKRVQAAERPDEIAFREAEKPVKKKAPKRKPAGDEEPFETFMDPDMGWKPLTVEETPEPEAAPEPEPLPPAEEVPTAAEPSLEETPAAEEIPAAAETPAEEMPAEETPAEETPAEETAAVEEAPTPAEAAPAPQPRKEEGTVRCVFCGGVMSRDSESCPHCGKKR